MTSKFRGRRMQSIVFRQRKLAQPFQSPGTRNGSGSKARQTQFSSCREKKRDRMNHECEKKPTWQLFHVVPSLDIFTLHTRTFIARGPKLFPFSITKAPSTRPKLESNPFSLWFGAFFWSRSPRGGCRRLIVALFLPRFMPWLFTASSHPENNGTFFRLLFFCLGPGRRRLPLS